ncbi:MAG: hypothetical protein ISS53_06055 [Dehalococcoidia bacterium]|nr:hypothetical protein [Dehalococcoidia bacterium]
MSAVLDVEIIKSKRHAKILGDFGENLVCNWLSRSGLEVQRFDYVGLDIVAHNPSTNERLGITVKSRTRVSGKEQQEVNIFSYQKGKNDRQKLLDACKDFGCQPWISAYVETSEYADLYLTSLENYDNKYGSEKRPAIDTWKIKGKYREQYDKDPNVKHIRFEFHGTNWSWQQ